MILHTPSGMTARTNNTHVYKIECSYLYMHINHNYSATVLLAGMILDAYL